MLMQDEGQDQSQTTTNWQFKPGETISPGAVAATPSQAGAAAVPKSSEGGANSSQAPRPSTPASSTPAHEHDSTQGSIVSWTASEFIAHQKTTKWYAILAVCGVVTTALAFLAFHDWITVIMVVIVFVVFGIFAGRKPRTLQYQLDLSGLRVGPKLYPYEDFKSFTIIDEGPISSITLAPMKRFMLPLTIYYDLKDEEHIATTLNDYIPYEENHNDPVDRFMRQIRF